MMPACPLGAAVAPPLMRAIGSVGSVRGRRRAYGPGRHIPKRRLRFLAPESVLKRIHG
jgi:hypothetical protein